MPDGQETSAGMTIFTSLIVGVMLLADRWQHSGASNEYPPGRAVLAVMFFNLSL